MILTNQKENFIFSNNINITSWYLNFNTATNIISIQIALCNHNIIIRSILIKFSKVTVLYYMIILLIKFYVIVMHHIVFLRTEVINNG